MQVTMTMEEYEELVNREYQLKEKYLTEILAMKNRFGMEINSLKSQLESKKIDDIIKSSGCDFCNGKKELTFKKGLDIGLSNNRLDFYFNGLKVERNWRCRYERMKQSLLRRQSLHI